MAVALAFATAKAPRSAARCCRPTLKRARRLKELIPWLYLKGIFTGDYQETLSARTVGREKQAPGLSSVPPLVALALCDPFWP